MQLSLNDAMTTLADPANANMAVGMTLTIHSQNPNPPPMTNYRHRVYYGFGYLKLAKQPVLGQRIVLSYLVTDPGFFKVLNNVSYFTDLMLASALNEYQTFIVKDPGPEQWNVRIDPSSDLKFLGANPEPPRLTVEVPGRSESHWSVALTEEDGFLRGIGRDPTAPNVKASYCIVFGTLQYLPGTEPIN